MLHSIVQPNVRPIVEPITNRRPSGGGDPPPDADAQAWADAVTLAGDTYTADDLTALSNHITSAKANGYWTKRRYFLPFMGDHLTAALIAYTDGVWAPATAFNFVNGDYSRATGLTGNGSSKYIDTGFAAGSLTTNLTHMSHYGRSSLAADGGIHAGFDNFSTRLISHFPFTDGNAYSDQYDASGGRCTAAALGTPHGWVTGTRTASNVHKVYRNGVEIGSSLAANALSLVGVAQTIFVFCMNYPGFATGHVSESLGAFAVGDEMSAAHEALAAADMQTLMTALGRNV